MSFKRPKKNTTKLPRALQDGLVSLGKLSSRKQAKRYSRSVRGEKQGSKPSRNDKYDGRKGGFPNRGNNIPNEEKVARASKPAPKVTESFSLKEDDSGDEEDERIAELEKKLGLDKDKRSTVAEDGLADLLEGIGTSKRGVKRKKGLEVNPTAAKYRIAEADSGDENDSSEMSFEEESEFEGISETSDSVEESYATLEASKQSLTNPAIPTGKYIPPAARKAQQSTPPTQGEDPRLHKQIQGTLNRLSESNMATILSEIESLYRTHPRANVASTLTTLLLTILTAPQSLLDTFVILHAGLVAALYRLIGLDFGAYLVQTLIERFDVAYKTEQKECVNLVGFLSELYNFGVVGAGLVYDLVRMFMEDLNEFSTELLLKVIQNSGQQLRQDDPSALKDIVILMQSQIAAQDETTLSVRTKFMVETIINLKNNRAKAVTATSVVSSEATIRMKKFLGKMGEKSFRSGGEPLRVTLSDIRNIKEKGKWWLVGASWKNDDLPLRVADSAGQEEDALLSLAREQRMNTEIRRAVFIALMGSEDYVDASTRITLLPLKKAHRTEIPRVLVHCCSNETTYNPFYALVAKRLCSPSGTPQVARVVRMGLQFNLWGVFREWGETTEDAEWADNQDEMLDDAAKLRKAVNLGKLYGTLVVEGVISLQILKVLGFINLQPLTKTFLEVFLTQLILHSQGDNPASRKVDPLLQCIEKLVETPTLAKGIDWYLRKKNVEKAGLSSGEAADCITWGVNIFRKGIAAIFQEE